MTDADANRIVDEPEDPGTAEPPGTEPDSVHALGWPLDAVPDEDQQQEEGNNEP